MSSGLELGLELGLGLVLHAFDVIIHLSLDHGHNGQHCFGCSDDHGYSHRYAYGSGSLRLW